MELMVKFSPEKPGDHMVHFCLPSLGYEHFSGTLIVNDSPAFPIQS